MLICLPLILLIGGLVLYPFFYSIYLACSTRARRRFVGLANYLFLLTVDTFWMVFQFSFLFTGLAVLLKTMLGFMLALHQHPPRPRPAALARAVPDPVGHAAGAVSLGWLWIFEPTLSALNWILALLGVSPKPWLSDPAWAKFSVILVNVWYGTPFFMIMFLAGLKSIPDELFEASAIDGATAWQRLRFITLPMIRNIIAITVLFSTIVTLATFDIVRVLTRGGPRQSTHLFATYAFELGIATGDVPLGGAVSLFMFPILAVSAFLILRGIRRNTT